MLMVVLIVPAAACRCSFMIYLPKDLHDAKVAKERCEVSSRQRKAAAETASCAGQECWAKIQS